ncbi:MAG: hypothetical protein NTX91_05345 [candidate division SR1 bacterium]|nr:hypothetical protein [candidate division SR1 bacterium]
MPGQFEALKIDNTLTKEETDAIDGLKTLKPEDLTKALKDETIKIAGQDKKLAEIAAIFSDCITVDKDNKFVLTEEDKKIHPRLDDMIKNGKDLAYFVYVVANALKTAGAEKLSQTEVNAETRTQLKSLKDLIEKSDKPTPTPEVTAELKESDITFTLYSKLQPADVVSAFTDLQKANPELAKTIMPLLKSGDVIGVQKALGMEENATALYKNADGKFGKNTLRNLKEGKVVVPTTPTANNNVPTSRKKSYNIPKNDNTPKSNPEDVIRSLSNDQVLDIARKINAVGKKSFDEWFQSAGEQSITLANNFGIKVDKKISKIDISRIDSMISFFNGSKREVNENDPKQKQLNFITNYDFTKDSALNRMRNGEDKGFSEAQKTAIKNWLIQYINDNGSMVSSNRDTPFSTGFWSPSLKLSTIGGGDKTILDTNQGFLKGTSNEFYFNSAAVGNKIFSMGDLATFLNSLKYDNGESVRYNKAEMSEQAKVKRQKKNETDIRIAGAI